MEFVNTHSEIEIGKEKEEKKNVIRIKGKCNGIEEKRLLSGMDEEEMAKRIKEGGNLDSYEKTYKAKELNYLQEKIQEMFEIRIYPTLHETETQRVECSDRKSVV